MEDKLDKFNDLVSALAVHGYHGADWNAVIADCLDAARDPQGVSIADVFDYKQSQDFSYADQARWDARNSHQPISQSQDFARASDGFAAMLNQVRRGS